MTLSITFNIKFYFDNFFEYVNISYITIKVNQFKYITK